jgi:NAD(P)H-dependent flavin oxidoreductase YrpB (nitropropane dioxygenase family)
VSGNAIGSENGVDLICAQAGEGGGHTGDIPASVLIPACVDAVKGHKSPLTGLTGTGKPVYVIGAGAVYDGRGLAANLMWGAEAVCAYALRVV